MYLCKSERMGRTLRSYIVLLKKERLECLYGFLLFLLLLPSYLWAFKFSQGFLLLLISSINFCCIKRVVYVSGLKLFSITLLFCFYFYSIQHRSFGAVILSLLFLTIFFQKEKFLLLSYKYFKLFLGVSLFLSIVFFFLYLVGVNLPHSFISPLNPLKSYNYIQYPFFVIPDSPIDRIIPRFCGMFDEPGVVGTFVGIILFIERCNFNKKLNIMFLVAGILSFSFYFFILTFIGFSIFLSWRGKIISCVVFILLFVSTKEISELDNLIWKRFEYVDNSFSGDNRSSKKLDKYYNRFIESHDLLWGRTSAFRAAESASYKQLVVRFGAVFCILYVFSLFIMAYSRIKNFRYIFIYMILLLSLLYQRPFIFDPIYFFILYLSILVFSNREYNASYAISEK